MSIGFENIVLALLWTALMLTFLLGDVLRIFSGNFVPGEMDGKPVNDSMWVVAAAMMVMPIVMILISLFIPVFVSKWISIVISVFFFLMNISGMKGYKRFDQLLLFFSFIINAITIYYAWSL